MHEDEIYRSSSQFRVWSYTSAALASLRATTNADASERVRQAIKRTHAAQQEAAEAQNATASTNHAEKSKQSSRDINCLTVEEELKIVEWGCLKIRDIGEIMEPPIPVEIIASQRRVVYRGRTDIMKCALFLATKSDHFHIPLSRFVSKIPKTTEEDIKAPEFLLMQGLRFTLDVRHPFRSLEGGVMEMMKLAEDGLLKDIGDNSRKRVLTAAEAARKTLKDSAQMTDAYFLYTPSQIWIAALMLSDSDLATQYLETKLRHLGADGEAMRTKLFVTLKSCSALLASWKEPDDNPAEKKETTRIGKKLFKCQNPEKLNIVALNAAQKRDGEIDAEKAERKRRKVEGKTLRDDADVFGPELKSV
ncbi:MAG: hypothetical protein Q9227_004373 [Pyrenula ochraceoflavens]